VQFRIPITAQIQKKCEKIKIKYVSGGIGSIRISGGPRDKFCGFCGFSLHNALKYLFYCIPYSNPYNYGPCGSFWYFTFSDIIPPPEVTPLSLIYSDVSGTGYFCSDIGDFLVCVYAMRGFAYKLVHGL